MGPETSDHRLPALHYAILQSLGNGSETTLLVLEMVNDPNARTVLDEPATETDIVRALTVLEAAQLVTGRTERREGVRDPRGGIPEYAEGRTEVVWWNLTQVGKRTLQDLDGAPA